MKISIINHDNSSSLKVDTYLTDTDMNQPETTKLMMGNSGTEPYILELVPGQALLLVAQPDMTLASNNKIIQTDSQQNIITIDRVDLVEKLVIPAPVREQDPELRKIDDAPVQYATLEDLKNFQRIPTTEELQDTTIINPDSQQNIVVSKQVSVTDTQPT